MSSWLQWCHSLWLFIHHSCYFSSFISAAAHILQTTHHDVKVVFCNLSASSPSDFLSAPLLLPSFCSTVSVWSRTHHHSSKEIQTFNLHLNVIHMQDLTCSFTLISTEQQPLHLFPLPIYFQIHSGLYLILKPSRCTCLAAVSHLMQPNKPW